MTHAPLAVSRLLYRLHGGHTIGVGGACEFVDGVWYASAGSIGCWPTAARRGTLREMNGARMQGVLGWSLAIGFWALMSTPAEGRDSGRAARCKTGAVTKCWTPCGRGVRRCVSGKWQACTAQNPQPEVCDGRDNNCNGKVDEGLRRPCSTLCGTGLQQCLQGDWGSCSAPRPSVEVCNGIDDDCDGSIDNGAQCPGNRRCQAGQCRVPSRAGERR